MSARNKQRSRMDTKPSLAFVRSVSHLAQLAETALVNGSPERAVEHLRSLRRALSSPSESGKQ